ncbi:hypothetical protein C8R42DRAFT_722051 [Lentinula raphanica]|nr:hypothetical protein C8R42DRAFT_722051 [Lentinula raphanica]
MAPERARRTSRRRTNQESYSPGPSSTMTLRSTMRKSQDANATITSRSTTAISTPTAVTGTAAGESNLLPAFHSSVDLVSHDLPLEARMLSNLAPLDTVVTPEGSSPLSEPASHVGASAYTQDLPLKPLIPVELPSTDPYIKRLEIFSVSTTLVFDEQEASIKSTTEYIELLTQLCMIVKKSQAGGGVNVKIEHAVYQQSTDVLKSSFGADVSNEEWLLIKALKQFNID